MFMFKKATTTIIVAFATIGTLAAIAANYPITPNDVADLHNLGPGVNTSESEYTPYITPDENFCSFSRIAIRLRGPKATLTFGIR
jgi:hypothetical protein